MREIDKPDQGGGRKPQQQMPVIPEYKELPWYQRFTVTGVTLVLFIIAFIASGSTLRGPNRELDYVANFWRFLQKMFPPDLSDTKKVLYALLETAQIGVVATSFAIVVAFPIAVAAAQNLSPQWLVLCMRMLLNVVRTIPSLIWALIAVAIVGPNALAGVIALAFYSLGYLGKFFSDTIESADIEVARGLRVMGANRIQAFQYGLWPNIKPLIWSYSLWMLEYNIRSASIIGYVGAGGVGFQLFVYQEYGQWDKFSTVLIFILVVVTILDFLGEWIRKKITKKLHYSRMSK